MKRANQGDMPQILTFCEAFHAYSPWNDIPFDRAATARFIETVVLPCGAVFLSDQGMIMGFLSPLHFNPDVKVVIEVAWYAPKGGRDLRSALEDWAREQGAYGLQCSALADSHSQAVGRLYRRAGYEAAETAYLKRL